VSVSQLNSVKGNAGKGLVTSKSSVKHGYDSTASVNSQFDNTLLLEQLLAYLCYHCLNCHQNQINISIGPPPSLLVQLCNFPVRYVTDERYVVSISVIKLS
jgi:hypothetical protein